MSLPQRKPPRLSYFDYSTPGAYFITICTQDRQNTLGRIVGGGVLDAPLMHLSDLGKTVDACIVSAKQVPGIQVDKYVIMPNHLHLILFVLSPPTRAASPANERVPHFVSGLKRLVHKQAGRRIFQRSYHDHIIRNETDYQRIWQYIDTNPASWQKDCFYHNEDLRGVEDAAPYDR